MKHQGEKDSFLQLAEYCRLQNKKGTIPHFLIVNNPDFEYVACLHVPEYKGQEVTRFLQTVLGFQSLEQFKKNTEVYECLNNGERSYQVLIQKIQGKDKFVKNTYSVKKKNFEIDSVYCQSEAFYLGCGYLERKLKIPETAKTKETMGFDLIYNGEEQMRYLSVTEIAKKWDVSERSVRNYCAQGRVNGAFLTGKTWNVPENAEKPERSNKKKEQPITLLDILQEQKASKYSGGIYHKTQIDLTYNSNHIEGSRLTHDQTRYIFETNTIGVEKEVLNVDDVIETANHFRCIDMIIDNAKAALTEKFIKELHLILKNGTSDSRKDWFAVGDYKKVPNEVGGMDTALPEEVADKMKALLTKYNGKEKNTFEDILDFHVKLERIHPFQDGNGRVGRLIMFKECLKYNIVPFIIEDNLKMFYYRGLKEWNNEKGYLTDTCLTAQDKYKAYLDYFRIEYR